MELDMDIVIRVGLVFLIPATNSLGFVLKAIKKRKGVDMPLTLILYLFAIAVASAYGFMTSTYEGWRYFIDSFVMCGLCQGFICAGISTKGYDAVMDLKYKKETEKDV